MCWACSAGRFAICTISIQTAQAAQANFRLVFPAQAGSTGGTHVVRGQRSSNIRASQSGSHDTWWSGWSHLELYFAFPIQRRSMEISGGDTTSQQEIAGPTEVAGVSRQLCLACELKCSVLECTETWRLPGNFWRSALLSCRVKLQYKSDESRTCMPVDGMQACSDQVGRQSVHVARARTVHDGSELDWRLDRTTCWILL